MNQMKHPLKFNIHLREPFSGFLSVISFGLAIAALVIMVVAATRNQDAWAIVSVSIFGTGLILLYISSSLYHLLPLDEKGIRILRKIDHMMIFVLIAATYTPFCLIALRGTLGWSLFGVIWVLAILGIILKSFYIHAPRWLSAVIYIGMGWICIIVIVPLLKVIALGGILWLAAGGMLYTIGALFYAAKWPDPFPTIFGAHEIWHLMLIAAGYCHFWSVYKYLL